MTSATSDHKVPPSCVVYTPPPLAYGIVRALKDDASGWWLEPCLGNGVFVEAITACGVPAHRIRALDVESSPSAVDRNARTLRGQEFLAWSLATRERFTRIVANPPFFALSRAPDLIRSAALQIPVPGGGTVPLGANCWFAFLCACIGLLRQGGSLGFILPAAWDYSDYARELRAVLPDCFGQMEIHRCVRPLFSGVQEGSIVLIARQFLGTVSSKVPSGNVRRIVHNTPAHLIDWLSGGSQTELARPILTPQVRRRSPSPTLRVGDIMQIRLGGVTGDSDFFLLSEEERKRQKLPIVACRPVISRAHHLSCGTIGLTDWQALRDKGERVWLFDPTPAQAEQKAVACYLKLEYSKGGCNRNAYKIRSREPWYRTPLPASIDGFMSGMSSCGPWVVFREMPRLAATNTLYVVKFLNKKSADERAALALWLLTTRAQKMLSSVGRRYAAGLLKFEPGDISDIPMETPIRTEGALSGYKKVVRLMVEGKSLQSQRAADSWFR
jgi:adenine-specific DNA-methyltransferase